ncbi:unnamed protein product, partial [Mesorhabditis belari]|uniref:BZIP domain-containing protein n=1 Tax=Mesorhabditis belari TaxID=2138241 RepID=A0AAF3EQV5_9BILA
MCAQSYEATNSKPYSYHEQRGYNSNYFPAQMHDAHECPSSAPFTECCFDPYISNQNQNPFNYPECVTDCPLMPLDCIPLDPFGQCPPDPCPDCDPKQPAVPIGSITHSIFPMDNQKPILCEHSISLHNHDDQGNITISHGHYSHQDGGFHSQCKRMRPSTPVKQIARELAEECEHLLRRDECFHCNRNCDSVPFSDISDAKISDISEPGNKKIRNKEAAQKYRNKLKSKYNNMLEEEKKLENEHEKLKKVVDKLDAEVQFYRQQLLENAAFWRKTNGIL